MKQPEAKFKQDLNQAFAAVFPGGWCAYVKALAKDGVPDLHYQILGDPGVWVEAKVGDNPLEKSQLRELKRMAAAGAVVRVLRLIKRENQKDLVEIQPILSSGGSIHRYVYWGDRSQRSFWSLVFVL